MMQRLRDQTNSPDATTARAAELLSAMQPLDARRVRGWAHPWAAVEASRRRSPLRRLRVAVTGALTFASLAAAAATAHRAHLDPWTWFGAKPAVTASVAAPSAPSPAGATRASDEEPSAPLAPVDDGVASPDPSIEGLAPVPHRSSPGGPAHEAPGASSSESFLMVQAVRALRRDGDPARAQALAEEALRRYPKGAQVEEAMVLAMEAASARGDRSGARRAAARYLDRYPSGRFADRAQRLVSGSRDGD
jgi:hypothetical protein